MVEKIYLSEDKVATLEVLAMDIYEERYPWINRKKPAIIIVPGGSYLYCSDREGIPVAYKFLAKGYQCFVLNYHCGDKSDYPRPFEDLSKAVAYVKGHADQYGIDKDRISILGFSAGGHLVGTYGSLIKNDKFQADMKMSEEELDVKNIVLGYPALHLKPIVDAVLKYKLEDKVGKLFTTYNEHKDGYAMAHKEMPRTFVFHAINDDVVPAILSVEYVKRLVELGVDVEFYMTSTGGHGFATGDDLANYGRGINDRISIWVDLVDSWIKKP